MHTGHNPIWKGFLPIQVPSTIRVQKSSAAIDRTNICTSISYARLLRCDRNREDSDLHMVHSFPSSKVRFYRPVQSDITLLNSFLVNGETPTQHFLRHPTTTALWVLSECRST